MKKIFCLLMAVVIFCSMNVPIVAGSEMVFELPSECDDCGSSDFVINGWVNGAKWDFVVECSSCGDYSVYLGAYDTPPLYVRSSDGLANYPVVTDFSLGFGFIYSIYLKGGQSYYFDFEESVQGIITGETVPNAEYYQLYEKRDSNYVLVRTNGELYFDLNEIMSEPGNDMPGDYTFVVVACGEGFESSDYSNEVVYTAK